MNYPIITVTHVEVSSQHFIKIHGQTNLDNAKNVNAAVGSMIGIFQTFPPPLMKMLNAGCVVLVYFSKAYHRGKFVGFDAGTTANVLLVDFGFTVNIELANLRVLSLAQNQRACDYLINEPALASEFILNRCIIYNDNSLSRIQHEILHNSMPFTIDDEFEHVKRISIPWNGGDYADHLVKSKICQAITAENQKKFLIPKAPSLTAARPPKTTNNNVQMQMISNHLGVRQSKVPQNMPSFHPTIIPPSTDYNLNHVEKAKPPPPVILNEQPAHYMPTFVSDTLLVNGRHHVYVSHVDDGPYIFSVQLKSSERNMEQMMASIATCPLQQLSRKPALGMACLARFSVDNQIYRAVIKSIHLDSCQLLYVDYGNSEKVLHNNIYDIPEPYLRLKTFAIRVSLAGLNNLPPLSDQVKNAFKDMVADKTLDMVVVPPDGKTFVQYCELSINGQSLLNCVKDMVDETPKFIEPATLSDGDFVVIRYVESPKLFCVQQTKNIVQHNAMIDKLCHYCLTARSLTKFEKGIACAARYKNDSEWYRTEIVSVSGNEATIRFVDYGIELQTEIAALKEIHYDFLMTPKQAVRCCLLGFESMQTVSNSSQDQMDLLAEDSLGERRNFRVKIHGKVGDAVLVNLMDESQLPYLDFSLRMLQLSLPQSSFRQYEMRLQNKASIPRTANVPPAVDVADPHHASLNEKSTSDSGFQDGASTSTRISNWDATDRRSNAKLHNPQNDSRDDSVGSNSMLNSSRLPDTIKIDVKESKFYKNTHPNPTNDQRNAKPSKPYVSSNVNVRRDGLSEGPIDPSSEIPIEAIAVNDTHQVKLSWFFSPLEFFVTTIKSDADLAYTSQMKNIHFFYKNKPPMTRKAVIGSLVIAKYNKNNELHRARIVDYDNETGKYKAQLIDVGALTIVNSTDLYEMDKIFAKLECRAIKCSLHGVALRASRFDMEDIVEKLLDDKKLTCKFIKKKADTFYVDINVDGVNVREVMLRDKYLSELSEDIDLERLVGQTVMAKIVSFKDLSSFQIVICGCETTFEVSHHKTSSNVTSIDKKLPKGQIIPIRIESFLVGKTFSVTPLIGETSPSPPCNLPFLSNNFKAYVVHWEDYNVAYVHSLMAHDLAESLLDQLFDMYDKGGDLLQDIAPGTLCAVKSSDENWYRAEIISGTQSEVNVRYLDYGNCESIPKSLVKRLDSKFSNTPALAVKVYLPLQKVYSDRKTSVEEIVKLTADNSLDLKVLEFCDRNWIVDMFIDDDSITTTIKQKNCCKSMSIDDLKKQIAHIETLQKVARLDAQKERGNQDVKTTSVMTNNVRSDPVPPKSAPPISAPLKSAPAASTQPISIQQPITKPAIEQTPQQVNGEKTSRTNVYISHIDRPDRFYLQISSTTAALEQLQEDIQIVAPSLPPLEDFSTDTRCIVRYSVDDQWYRATIIDSGSGITSILFIDYGNTDTITDNSLIKSMNDAFDRIPPYAIPCALPLEAKDRMEWSEEACELLRNLVQNELEFEYVCKGKSNNFVKLYHEGRDIMQQLIDGGHAIKLESIRSGTICYVSHINSISDFYIQMENDRDALEKVSDYLLDVSKLDVVKDIKEGVVCAAKYSEDGLWYRAKILSRNADTTEVFFVDYGNSSLTNELRTIPSGIANAPSLARYCSMVKPKDIQYWSESAERRFNELTDNGAVFVADVVSPGKKSSVDLLVDNRSILEDISPLCDKYSLSQLENTLQSNANATTGSETVKAQIVDGSASKFYIQMESDSSKLDEMLAALENACTWPALGELVVGQMCAALFEGGYYRAKILSLGEGGALVHYVDYGNQSFSTDLRQLPENLKQLRHLAICCRLETVSSQLIERFEKLSKDDTYEMKFVSKESSPAIVQLFVRGVKFQENVKVKAFISELIAPDQFYIQLNNDMEAAMTSANEFPLLEDGHKCAGKLCAALWEDAFYRAEILTVGEDGIKVHFIDYGNESYATDLRKLPDNLEKIERASMLCALENEKGKFSSDFIGKFANLDLDREYEFEVLTETSPRMVRIYVNGELLTEDSIDSINVPKNGHITANSDNNVNDTGDQRSGANEITDNSLNGTRASNSSTMSADVATQAKRIEEVHIKSLKNAGMG
ncbi:maternal protein tudor-like [Bradysia coprophila]|uniref:maternal protein tudor-like n=1 Tax=Bradysia coprophila TaxID=38358 RepID=UPI00187DBC90|nr:maternal protein tudor-like [Bradysia coprophila]